MSFSDWSVIAELVSALGVIVSLIYLSAQVRSNTKQVKAQGHRMLRDEYLSKIDECTKTKENSEIFIKGLNHFDEMSAIEQGCFHSLIHPVLHGFHSIWESNKAGIIGNNDVAAALSQFLSLINSPGGRQWWEAFKHIPPREIVAYIDDSMRIPSDKVLPATEILPWLRHVD